VEIPKKEEQVIKRTVAAFLLTVVIIPFAATSAFASEIVDSQATDKVECFFRVYIQEGGENGLDCLT
jgi:hypothetical protein